MRVAVAVAVITELMSRPGRHLFEGVDVVRGDPLLLLLRSKNKQSKKQPHTGGKERLKIRMFQ